MSAPRRDRIGGLPPLALALAAQLVAAAPVFGAGLALAAATGATIPLPGLLALQGAAAALLGMSFGLARWWAPIQLLLPAAVAAGLWLPVPAWVYLAAFLGLLLVFWNSAGDRVPLYLTNRKTWAELARLLPEKGSFGFIDLGSGLGGALAFLARRRPDGRFTGIETAPVPYALSKLRLSGLSNSSLRWGDIWDEDLSRYDVVYCFLSPAPMPALYRKARAEMRPGTLFVSNSFAVPGSPADSLVAVDDRRRTRLHIWRM